MDGGLLSLALRVENDVTDMTVRDHLNEAMGALLMTVPRLHGIFIIDERAGAYR